MGKVQIIPGNVGCHHCPAWITVSELLGARSHF